MVIGLKDHYPHCWHNIVHYSQFKRYLIMLKTIHCSTHGIIEERTHFDLFFHFINFLSDLEKYQVLGVHSPVMCLYTVQHYRLDVYLSTWFYRQATCLFVTLNAYFHIISLQNFFFCVYNSSKNFDIYMCLPLWTRCFEENEADRALARWQGYWKCHLHFLFASKILSLETKINNI